MTKLTEFATIADIVREAVNLAHQFQDKSPHFSEAGIRPAIATLSARAVILRRYTEKGRLTSESHRAELGAGKRRGYSSAILAQLG